MMDWMLWPLAALAVYWCLVPFAEWMRRVLEMLGDIRVGLQKIEDTQEELLLEAALTSSYLRAINEAINGPEAESVDPFPHAT